MSLLTAKRRRSSTGCAAASSAALAAAAAGIFVQDFSETVTVVVIVRVGGDPLEAKAIDQLSPIVRKVILAVAGWGPGDAPGVFVLERGELVGATGGASVFQIDFALDDQLRI